MVTTSPPLYVSRPEHARRRETAHNCKSQLYKWARYSPWFRITGVSVYYVISVIPAYGQHRPINAIPRRRHISMPYTHSNSVTLIIISTLEALKHFVSRHKMLQNPEKSGKPEKPGKPEAPVYLFCVMTQNVARSA